jgi:hypothetical protein
MENVTSGTLVEVILTSDVLSEEDEEEKGGEGDDTYRLRTCGIQKCALNR